jgi:hypothetical protein
MDNILRQFLAQAQRSAGARPLRDYVALHAYVAPNAITEAALQDLAQKIRNNYQLAVTIGYGPRFLHSTGQLHKGDAGNGLFLQFSDTITVDAAIPDKAGAETSSMTFGTLIMAQSWGDHQALLDNQRRVIRFDLGTEFVAGLKKLTQWI